MPDNQEMAKFIPYVSELTISRQNNLNDESVDRWRNIITFGSRKYYLFDKLKPKLPEVCLHKIFLGDILKVAYLESDFSKIAVCYRYIDD